MLSWKQALRNLTWVVHLRCYGWLVHKTLASGGCDEFVFAGESVFAGDAYLQVKHQTRYVTGVQYVVAKVLGLSCYLHIALDPWPLLDTTAAQVANAGYCYTCNTHA